MSPLDAMSKQNEKYKFWLEVVRYVCIVVLILGGCSASVGVI